MRLGQGLGILHINSYYMDAAYHCHTDDGWIEMEKSPPFFLASQVSECIVEHGFDWSQLEHLSVYFNT